MKPRQAARKLKSLYHRQRLLEDLPELESEVIQFVEETRMKSIAGYKIDIDHGKVRITAIQVNAHQLDFDFIQEESSSGKKPP